MRTGTGGADSLTGSLESVDPEIARLIAAELERQEATIDMVASENFAPASVLQAQGSVLQNKYAVGYPGARHYDGCEFVDEVENLAIARAKALFGADHANVQPYSGSSAQTRQCYKALCSPGDPVLGFDFSQGWAPDALLELEETFAGRFYRGEPMG